MKRFTSLLFLLIVLAISTNGLVFAQGEQKAAASSKVVVNINTAGQADLEKLPGIGPSLAKKIIEFRQKNGNFKSAADITVVPGVGDKKYEQLKDMITVK